MHICVSCKENPRNGHLAFHTSVVKGRSKRKETLYSSGGGRVEGNIPVTLKTQLDSFTSFDSHLLD